MSEHESTRREVVEINLDELAELIGWQQEKRADRLLIINDTIVIIEETGNIHPSHDVGRLVKIIEAILDGPLRDYVPQLRNCPNIRLIVGIIHATGKKGKTPEYIATENRKLQEKYRKRGIKTNISLLSPASCNRDLRNKLRKIGIEL